MKSPFHSLVLALPVLFFLFPIFRTKAQPFIIERDGQSYYESDKVFKYKLSIPHDTIVEFVQQNFCTNWDGRRGSTKCSESDEYQGYEIAGFCFIPKWDISEAKKRSIQGIECTEFTSEGLSIALVLWKPPMNGLPSEMILAGFGSDASSIAKALSPSPSKNPNFLGPYVEESNKSLKNRAEVRHQVNFEKEVITSKNSSKQELQFIQNTREFDLVFLGIAEYLYLATDQNYYKGGQRNHEGIIIERSGLDLLSTDWDHNNLPKFRSLIFQPDIPPDRPEVANRSSIAYVQGKPCPPGWAYQGRAIDAVEALIGTVEHYMKSRQKVRFINVHDTIQVPVPSDARTIGIGLHAGRPLQVNSAITDSLNFELALEFFLKNLKIFSLEALIGRYGTAEIQKTYGLNLLLRVYVPLPQTINYFKIYGNLGAGIYDFPESLEAGLIGGAGIVIQPFPDLNLRLETGLQYQHVNFFTNSVNPTEFLSGKIGLKLIF